MQRRLRETWGGNDSDIEIREGKHRHRDSGVDSETDIWVETLRHKDLKGETQSYRILEGETQYYRDSRG